jgi:hypothetical protein
MRKILQAGAKGIMLDLEISGRIGNRNTNRQNYKTRIEYRLEPGFF